MILPPAPAAMPSDSGGFQWGDAGIGAAAAVVLMGAGTAAAAGSRRHRRDQRLSPTHS